MSELYTTGEIAKICKVSVRTVQYYDTRGILVPSCLSEGGRRLYSDQDLRKLQIICYLRNMGLPINSISELLADSDPASVIEIILSEHGKLLRDEINEKKEQLASIEYLSNMLKSITDFSVDSIADIAYIMDTRKKLYRVRLTMLTVGIISELIEIAGLVLWIAKGIWWPYVAFLPVTIALAIWITAFYFKKVDYICPKCHTVFRPNLKEAFFAAHTPTTRKLTCTCCNHKGFCIETYRKETLK